MNKVLYQPHVGSSSSATTGIGERPIPVVDWRRELPTLHGSAVTLRELRPSDAALLLTAMSTQNVARFLSPPPASVDSFEKFIIWARQQRAAGQLICFAAVQPGSDNVVGLFQIRSLEPRFQTAEWGFALAAEHWGSGMFATGAKLALDFAFNVVGTRRLEARAAVGNGRGNGALKKLGARQEAMLRRSFLRNGEYYDQLLWSILADEWHGHSIWEPQIAH